MELVAKTNPPCVSRGRERNLARRQEKKTIGRVIRQAASGSFQAVDVKATRSIETRIVAGRLMENTKVANRSACVLVKMPRDRSKIPTTNVRMKT
jgi:hypothetical protein